MGVFGSVLKDSVWDGQEPLGESESVDEIWETFRRVWKF